MTPYRRPAGLSDLISTSLLPWFAENARDLPWRVNRTPYRVWISEAMLQQTRVETVIAYYQRWMKQFPTVTDLAEADQEAVLKCWEGMGYYARARNLHKAARMVVEEHGGELPSDPEALRALPGIGPYTQAAVLSLAFGQSYAVLDGNVERVLTRMCAVGDDLRQPATKARLKDLIDRLLADHPPGPFNEAMMELGATVCTPGRPNCGVCPVATSCKGRKTGEPEQYPVKSKKKPVPVIEVGAAITWREDGRFLIAKRKEEDMLGGLWEFPGGKKEEDESMEACVAREQLEELGIEVEVGERLTRVRHVYSHFKLLMDVHHCRWVGGEPAALDCADFRWVTREDCEALPFSKADQKVLRALDKKVAEKRS